MPDLKRRVHDVVKRWKDWLTRVVIGGGVVAFLYMGTELWRRLQEVDLNTLPATLVFLATVFSIAAFAQPYWRVILVAVVGMVIGAAAGFLPYLVIVIFLILLELSAEGQATSKQLSELFNNDVFWQLFFVAGAASGGPIAVYVYIEDRKKEEGENDSDAENDNGR